MLLYVQTSSSLLPLISRSIKSIPSLNPLARITPGGALGMTTHTARTRPRSLTWCTLSYTHAIITQQTAVDRARSQDDNSLKIAHGPHKKKWVGAFSLCGAVRFLCVAGPYRGCTTYYARMYTVMAVFACFASNFLVFLHTEYRDLKEFYKQF